MSEEITGLVKLTGLWKQEDKDGKVYYSGGLSYSTNILLFPNKYKQSADDKNPDLILYIAKKEKPKPKAPDPEEDPGKDEDIPF